MSVTTIHRESAVIDDEAQREGIPDVFCEECAALFTHVGARGWRVFEEVDGPGVWYCPTCAEREFGPLPGNAATPHRVPFRRAEDARPPG